MKGLRGAVSQVQSLPGLRALAPPAEPAPTHGEKEGYRKSQSLARDGVREIASLLCEGWTERDAARLLDEWLKDNGVEAFFHHAFVWFGERTRFDGIRRYRDFLPTGRVLRPGEPYILDVAPVYNEVPCDIGFSGVFEESPEWRRAQEFLADIREKIPPLFDGSRSGGEIWGQVEQWIEDAGYDPIHKKYPFSVLGHRLHRERLSQPSLSVLNFGWHAYWDFLSRGLFGQFLDPHYQGTLQGLWAVEPHIGASGFGAKFEEILVVDQAGARWLDEAFL